MELKFIEVKEALSSPIVSQDTIPGDRLFHSRMVLGKKEIFLQSCFVPGIG